MIAALPNLPKSLAPIDWVICGGESGHDARPMHPDWARSLRDQCRAAGVAFFFKQWGEWAPEPTDPAELTFEAHKARGARDAVFMKPDLTGMELVGKRRAGRLLDGREWNEVPELANAPAAGGGSDG